MAATWNLRQIMGLSPATLYKLEEDVYATLNTMVYNTIFQLNEREDRHKVMDILKFEAPHLRFTHSTRQKLVTFMLRYIPYIYIDMYYSYSQIVYKKVWKIWKK